MRFIGVDLHKQTLSACVISRETGKREVVQRRSLRCIEVEAIAAFLKEHSPCQVVVEATASYEWFAVLAEPIVDRVVLAHPSKLRVIAESTRKTDKLDAQVLAEFLSMDMIPQRRVQKFCNCSARQIAGFPPSAPKWFSYSEVAGGWLSNDQFGQPRPVHDHRFLIPRGPGAVEQSCCSLVRATRPSSQV